MIVWKKVEAGKYISEDGRFAIYKAYDRLYGNRWVWFLYDEHDPDCYKWRYQYASLRDCKRVAETLMKR